MLYYMLNDDEGKIYYNKLSTFVRNTLENIRLRYKISQPFKDMLFSIDEQIKLLSRKYKTKFNKSSQHNNKSDPVITKQIEIKPIDNESELKRCLLGFIGFGGVKQGLSYKPNKSKW
jgi:hypothetical protein